MCTMASSTAKADTASNAMITDDMDELPMKPVHDRRSHKGYPASMEATTA
jgi:hypothetical protein